MTASLRVRIPVILLPVLVLAFAFAATAAPSALATEGPPSCDEVGGDMEGCPEDQCPDVQGYQSTNQLCLPAPTPAPEPAPAPAPAPVDVCPEVEGLQTDASQCLPDEAPAPGIDVEASSLTIETVQHDPPATVGPEETILAAAEASGSGTSAVVTPTGSLPYTGMTVTHVAILGVALLWVGSLAWMVGTVVRRRHAVAAAA